MSLSSVPPQATLLVDNAALETQLNSITPSEKLSQMHLNASSISAVPRTSTENIGCTTISDRKNSSPNPSAVPGSHAQHANVLPSSSPATSMAILPDYAVGFYVRVQLPTGDTTMIMVDENTSISEVIRGVELKKDINLDNCTVTVTFPGDKRVEADGDQILSNFKEIEKLVINGFMITPNHSAPPTYSASGKRGSILSTPAGKHMIARVSSDVFPHASTEGDESRTPRSFTRSRISIKSAITTLFSKKSATDLDLNHPLASSSDALNRNSAPRSAIETHSNMHESTQSARGDSKRSSKNMSSLDISEGLPKSRTRMSAISEGNSLALLSSPGGSVLPPSSIVNAATSVSPPRMMNGAYENRFLSPSVREASPLMSPPSPSMASEVRSVLFPAPGTYAPKSHFLSDAGRLNEIPHLSQTIKEEDTDFKQSEDFDSADSREGKASQNSLDPLDASLSSINQSSSLRIARRRSQSQPLMRPKLQAPLRKSNYADRINSPASSPNGAGGNGSTNTSVAGNSNAATTTSPNAKSDATRMIFVKMHYLDDAVAVLKIPGDTTLEQLCARICKRRSYDFDTHTFEFMDKNVPAEMDRRFDFYAKDGHQLELKIVKKNKVYSTICINEDGTDVMLMQVINKKMQVMAATVNKILDLVTDAQDHDDNFLDMVLLTFRSFMTQQEFLNQLMSRFYCQLPPDSTPEDIEYFNTMQIPTQRRVMYVIEWWIENHWHDFGLSTDFRYMLEGFLQEIASYPEYNFELECQEIIKRAEKKREWFEDMLATYTLGERRVKKLDSMFDELDPLEMAQQLCLYNHSLFKNIHPIEFLNEIWVKDNDGSPSFKFFVERFDRESYWVATELLQLRDIKKRTSALKKFVNLVKESLDLNNFFSTFSLIAGLNLTPVQRLKKTWEALPEKTKKLWQEVEKIADPSKNMKNYRDRIAAATPPMVPFLPIYLKDLTFINDGNQSKVRGMINVEKLRMMSSRVVEITSLARSRYPFEPKPAILNYLAKPKIDTDMNKLKEVATEIENL